MPKFGEATVAVLNITILRKRIRWSARCQIQRICSFDTGEKKLNAARPAEPSYMDHPRTTPSPKRFDEALIVALAEKNRAFT